MPAALAFLLLLAACTATPPAGSLPSSSGRGSASMPQPVNSLPPGARVNAGIEASTGPGAVTTRVGTSTVTNRGF